MTGETTDGQGVRYNPLAYAKSNPGYVQPETILLGQLFHFAKFVTSGYSVVKVPFRQTRFDSRDREGVASS